MQHPAWTSPTVSLMSSVLALTCLASLARGAAGVSDDAKAEWKRRYDAMLDAKGALRPTDKLSSGIAADRQAAAPLPGDLSPAHVVLRRTEALLRDLRANGGQGLEALARALEALQEEAADKSADFAFYERACALRRRIAFRNPLLRIDAILFAKCRFRGMNMTDMACGHNAVPEGSALCVLRDPFGPEPRVVDLLTDVVVQAGRYKGRTLAGGQFCSPELSYDGKTIYFAWTEKGGPGRNRIFERSFNLHNTYKIFRVALEPDGTASGPVQLTDGPWNDTDPVELPNGRVAFVSGRENTTIRCNYSHSYAVNNTLFSMKPDGSDVVQLSWHETGEWAPSVGNDGMLVYTRWDYVDRQFEFSHCLWTCYPDGRDPRAPHGNYPERKRGPRPPAVELGLRALPGRQGLYVASTGGRHQTRGSLVLIDTSIRDDRGVGQIKVVTPELGFGWRGDVGAYATPWPLSEKYFLAAASYRSKEDKHGTPLRGGLCYVDVFGNRELLCSGGEHECLDPIPLRPRPRPPALPGQGHAGPDGGPTKATIVVANVYDSHFAWPAGTEIKRLRVIQVLPKTTLHKDDPRIGFTPETGPRIPLGTVPVMEDGSAYFEAPVGREIYFQALDANGLAVQSMRSGTYVHPGERLVCAGCHEDKWRSPAGGGVNMAALLAVRKAPDGGPWKIEPELTDEQGRLEVLTFPRHVQPILNRRCVACHRKEGKGPKLDDTTLGRTGWFASYEALRAQAFWHRYKGAGEDFSQSIAGKTGAKGSKLLAHLDAKRRDARLTEVEYRTLTLWLDCLSPFFGWDRDTEQQLRGEPVVPRIQFDPADPLGVRQAAPAARGPAEIAAEAAKASGPRKAALLEALARHRSREHLDVYVANLTDEDETVRRCALRVVADLGDAGALPPLIAAISGAKTYDDAPAYESPAAAICARATDKQACAATIAAALPKATAPGKCALLRLLGGLGGEEGARRDEPAAAERRP